MLNYKSYYSGPTDYLTNASKSPRKPRKPNFLDGIDPKFLLSKEESQKPRHVIEEQIRKKQMQEKERQLRKPGIMYDKQKTIKLI